MNLVVLYTLGLPLCIYGAEMANSGIFGVSQGLWAHEATASSLSGLSIAIFTHGLGWSSDELEVFLANVRKDLRSSRIHSYWSM